jgi:hypothetical protein
MAVGADHLALRHLVENALPVSVRERLADVEQLVAEVIELQDDWILFTTVETWVGREELDQVLRAF